MGKGSNNTLEEAESASSSSQTQTQPSQSNVYYSREQVRKHNKKDDCWIIVNENVYDITRFQHIHPGGSRIIKSYLGQDATEVFNAFHKELDRVNKYAKSYLIGRVHPKDLKSGSSPMSQLATIEDFQKNRDIRADFQQVRQIALEKVFLIS